MDGNAYLADAIKRFHEIRQQCDGAIGQVPPELWSRRLDPESNSIVTLVLHLAGNMISRWTDFLTTDGEKADRNRDAEFEDPDALGHEALLARWEKGWACLFGALEGITGDDLERIVVIRSKPHSVVEAINRQLTHYAYHSGQLVFLSKHLAGAGWKTLSIARRGSAEFNESMMGEPPRT